MFFDNPALHEHLEAVQSGWLWPVAGRVGRRWVEEICAAAWRVIVATEPDNVDSNNFSVSYEDGRAEPRQTRMDSRCSTRPVWAVAMPPASRTTVLISGRSAAVRPCP
jgi:hypothetical protein